MFTQSLLLEPAIEIHKKKWRIQSRTKTTLRIFLLSLIRNKTILLRCHRKTCASNDIHIFFCDKMLKIILLGTQLIGFQNLPVWFSRSVSNKNNFWQFVNTPSSRLNYLHFLERKKRDRKTITISDEKCAQLAHCLQSSKEYLMNRECVAQVMKEK